MRVIAAALLTLSTLTPAALLVSGCSEATAAAPAAAVSTVTFDVDGMTCESCESAIKAAVEKLPGVRSCTASHAEKMARVELEAGATTDKEALASAIRGLGYTVTAR